MSSFVCSGCYDKEYCSIECQREDYPLHKLTCLNIGKKALSKKKAKEILRHGSVHGHKLTEKQKKYMYYMSEK